MTRTIAGIIFVVALLGSLTQGCRQPNNPKRLMSIDSLVVVVDSLAERLDAIDTVPLLHMDSVFNAQRAELEAYFTDTLQRDTALVAGKYYRAMYKSLPRAISNRRAFRKAVDESRKQLTDLQRDAIKGIWKEEEELAFYERERLIVFDLYKSTEVIEKSAATSLREWEAGHQLVDSLLSVRRRTPKQ